MANASHELRTPLAIQRTLVDVALADPDATPEELRAMAVSVRDAVDRSEGLIEGLLLLARSQQGVGETDTVDLAEIAAAALDQVGHATASPCAVTCGPRPSPATGCCSNGWRPTWSRTPSATTSPDGWMEVVTDSTEGRATLTVRNGGPPIPPEQVAGLFEPFRRLSPDRVGTGRGHGLGLSIVEAIATAHRGSVRAEAPAGGGLTVTVDLPAVTGAIGRDRRGGRRRPAGRRAW